MIKKNSRLFLIFALISLVLLINTGCKDFGIPEYSFTVILGEGVSGSPEAGSYSYKELSIINYDYIFTDDADRLPNVFVNDGASSDPSIGYIIMYRDIEIFVGDVDIKGSWKLSITDDNDNVTETTITFTGSTYLEGSFTDSRGYEGTWKNTDNNLFMSYTNWTGQVFEGNISPKYLAGNMFSGDDTIGSWSMVKQ